MLASENLMSNRMAGEPLRASTVNHLASDSPAESSPDSKPPMIPRNRTFIAVVIGLLAVNVVISFVTGSPEERERVPYQPFFVDQVEAGNVSEISSQVDSIE